jgi:hypothetical protein
MLLRSPVGPDVDDAPAAAAESVGDQAPVAPSPIPLRAHDRGGLAARKLLEPLEAGGELVGLHVLGVAAERVVAPHRRGPSGGPARPPASAELLAERLVVDSGGGERVAKRAGIELRMAPRARKPPDVAQDLDAMTAEEGDETVDRVRGMPDRKQLVTGGHTEIVAALTVPRIEPEG